MASLIRIGSIEDDIPIGWKIGLTHYVDVFGESNKAYLRIGENNPNFEKRFINNGLISIFIPSSELLPLGFEEGRLDRGKNKFISSEWGKKRILKDMNVPYGWEEGLKHRRYLWVKNFINILNNSLLEIKLDI